MKNLYFKENELIFLKIIRKYNQFKNFLFNHNTIIRQTNIYIMNIKITNKLDKIHMKTKKLMRVRHVVGNNNLLHATLLCTVHTIH